MVTRSCRMRARVAQATVRVWVEGRDDPCSLTVLVDPEGVDLSRPECFSPRAFMKSPSIYKRVWWIFRMYAGRQSYSGADEDYLRWQEGQKNELRSPAKRRIVLPHPAGHGSPALLYTWCCFQ